MNNCNAGVESITLAPDGNYYICPGFYIDNLETPLDESIRGVNIPNQYLYEIANSPICRKCDAWHCRRCVYLNKKTTLEVNSPSHEQCVISHIERNCSKQLLDNIKKVVMDYLPETEIEEIDYLDPFDKL
jgi:CXXX repeat peptide maturase